MSNTGKKRPGHQEILDSLRTKQKARQRKRNIFVYGGFGLVLAAIITAVAIIVTGSIQEKNATAEAAKSPSTGSRHSPACPATMSRTPSSTLRSPASEATMRPRG